MQEHTESNERAEEPNFGVLAVPDALVPDVVAYVQTLIDDEAETSGYMIGGIGGSAIRPGALKAVISHTNCVFRKTGDLGTDCYCAD